MWLGKSPYLWKCFYLSVFLAFLRMLTMHLWFRTWQATVLGVLLFLFLSLYLAPFRNLPIFDFVSVWFLLFLNCLSQSVFSMCPKLSSTRASLSSKTFSVCSMICLTYSSSDNLAPPISWVLIGRHMIFCSLTSRTCCNLPQKCTPVKYKARQKAGFQLSHTQPP